MGYFTLCDARFLTSCRGTGRRQGRAGSLISGRLESGTRSGKFPRMVGNHSEMREGSLTATPTGGAGTKILRDLVIRQGIKWIAIAQRMRLPWGYRAYHQEFTSTEWFGTRCRPQCILGWSRSKGWAVRPLKRYARLGSERRETVHPIRRGRKRSRGAVLSTRGLDGRTTGVSVAPPGTHGEQPSPTG